MAENDDTLGTGESLRSLFAAALATVSNRLDGLVEIPQPPAEARVLHRQRDDAQRASSSLSRQQNAELFVFGRARTRRTRRGSERVQKVAGRAPRATVRATTTPGHPGNTAQGHARATVSFALTTPPPPPPPAAAALSASFRAGCGAWPWRTDRCGRLVLQEVQRFLPVLRLIFLVREPGTAAVEPRRHGHVSTSSHASKRGGRHSRGIQQRNVRGGGDTAPSSFRVRSARSAVWKRPAIGCVSCAVRSVGLTTHQNFSRVLYSTEAASLRGVSPFISRPKVSWAQEARRHHAQTHVHCQVQQPERLKWSCARAASAELARSRGSTGVARHGTRGWPPTQTRAYLWKTAREKVVANLLQTRPHSTRPHPAISPDTPARACTARTHRPNVCRFSTGAVGGCVWQWLASRRLAAGRWWWLCARGAPSASPPSRTGQRPCPCGPRCQTPG